MPSLTVPLIRQPKYSVDCGVACVAMLLEYYGMPYDYKKLRKEIGVFTYGTFMPQLGLYLLKHDFEVEIITMHPSLFTLFSSFSDTQALIKHLKGLRRRFSQKYDDIGLDFFVKFIQAGGRLTPRIPVIEDIHTEINHGRPVMSSLVHEFLFKNNERRKVNFHFNVVTGYTTKNILVNDPDWGVDFGGKHEHGTDEYMYGIHASAYGGIDNASIMKVKSTEL